MKILPLYSLLSLCLVLTACSGDAPATGQWETMGTVAAVSVPAASKSDLAVASKTTRRVFDAVQQELSTYDPASALSRINAKAGSTEWTIVTPEVLQRLHRATYRVWRASGGAFDPTIGPLMSAWGFRGDTPVQPPPAQAISNALSLVDYSAIQTSAGVSGEPPKMRIAKKGVRLDYGGIAKGYAVDLAYEDVSSGLTNLLIDLAGNMRARGEGRPGVGAWRIAVRNPFDRDGLLGSFLLTGGRAVATSGNYERYVIIKGIRYAHILDPRTGMPVRGIAGTTVIADTATEADALSTALFVLGTSGVHQLLKAYPDIDFLIVTDEEKPRFLCSRGFLERFEPISISKDQLEVISNVNNSALP